MGDINLLNLLQTITQKLFVIIGGTGGILYWWDRIQNRSRLKVHSWDETLLDDYGSESYFINFEIESLGNESNSLGKFISLRGFTGANKKFLCNFVIESSDRNLPPHTPQSFKALLHSGVKPVDLLFSWFKRYTIVPTRGRSIKIYIRSANKIRLSYLRYEYEPFMAYRFNRRYES